MEKIWEKSTFVFPTVFDVVDFKLHVTFMFFGQSCQFWGSHGTDGVKITRDVLSKLVMAWNRKPLVSSSNLSVAPLWCDLGFVPNSRGNKAAANPRPTRGVTRTHSDILTSTLQRLSAACTHAEFSLAHRARSQQHTNVSRVRSSYSCRAGKVRARRHRATGLQATGSIPKLARLFFRAPGRV